MIKPNQLPIEVMNEFHAALLHGESYAEAFAAALNAWPGMALDGPVTANGRWLVPPVVVLPLPQENAHG